MKIKTYEEMAKDFCVRLDKNPKKVEGLICIRELSVWADENHTRKNVTGYEIIIEREDMLWTGSDIPIAKVVSEKDIEDGGYNKHIIAYRGKDRGEYIGYKYLASMLAEELKRLNS